MIRCCPRLPGAARRLAKGCWPWWSSDGGEPSVFALTLVLAVLIHFIRTQRRGRPPASQVGPDPRLRDGQVVKQRAGRRLIAVTRRVIFEVEELIPPRRSTKRHAGKNQKNGHFFVFLGVSSWMQHFLELDRTIAFKKMFSPPRHQGHKEKPGKLLCALCLCSESFS
jgi:hypothetical protein